MMLLRLVALSSFALALAACQVPTRPLPPDPPEAGAEEQPSVPPPAPASAPAQPSKPSPPKVPDAPVVARLRGGDVYARLVAQLADKPCVKDRVVQRWEKIYARWPPRLRSHLENILPLMALVLDELETHHLPGEFALLPIVESWYRPDAGSPRLAYGMWQFTTTTGRNQGLRILPGFDERLAPLASTRAAMRYLASLQNRFGDWRLADMAFNAGEYRLLRALAKQKRPLERASAAAHLPPGLSMTTYEHLAKVQALACLIAKPRRFALKLPKKTRIEPLQLVTLPTGIDTLELAATHARLDGSALRALNPAFLQGRIAAGAPREVLLPRSAARRLGRATLAQRDRTAVPDAAAKTASTPRASEYRVRPGDTLSGIAQRHGLRLLELLRWNRIDVRALIRPGQILRLEP